MIKLNLVALDYIDGDSLVSAVYDIEGLTTENLLTIGDIGYSSTFKNSEIKLTLEETDSLQLFAVCDLLDDVNFEPIAEKDITTQVYLDIFETSDLIYVGEVRGNKVEDTASLVKAFNKWLDTKQAVTEAYAIKYGYGDVVKSFDALEDAVDFVNAGMKNKDSEHFVLYNDDKEMIWLDQYRDRNFSDVGYTVSRHNDKSVEFDKAAKVLKVKKEEVKLEDNKVMHDVINSSLAKIKAYDAMQAVFKFRFVDSRKKPTKVDFENKIVFYDDYADRTKIAQDIAKQYKEYKKSMANKWHDVDDNLVEAVTNEELKLTHGFDHIKSVAKLVHDALIRKDKGIKVWTHESGMAFYVATKKANIAPESLKQLILDTLAENGYVPEKVELIDKGDIYGFLVGDIISQARMTMSYQKTEGCIESISEGMAEDSAWSEEEVRAELIKMTNNFKKNEGEITTWYEEEKDHIKNILEAASYQVEVSDGRKNKDDDMNWVITFVKKVNESLTESLYLLSLSDDSRNWSVAVEADSEEAAKDTFYANVGNDTSIKINSVDEVEEKNLSKDIKIVRKHPIEESLDFDYNKKLTISEMYDFLLKVGAEEGCDIILDWRYDNDLATPKTVVEWLDLIIETYYDLEDDLRREGDIEQIERNHTEVIDPLEDLRDEMNNEALVKIDEIYYEVLSYNDDSGDDDFDDYLTFEKAEAAFEKWVRDFKTNGVNGAVELLQVDDVKRTSKQLRYWSSEDDKLYKYDESLEENDYGCDKCGKRVPEDKIHWFFGAEVGLCNDCHDKMTDEERYQLDDGNFSSLLKEANKTKAQRHNDMMNKVFDNAKKQNQILKDILKDNGVSEEEIAELEKATGLHGSALHKKVYDLGLNDEFAKRLGLKEDITEDHLTLDGDTLDTIKDFINDAFEYMREDEVELSDEVRLYATPTRDRENNQEVTFDVIENDVILDSVVGYPGNTEYCYETITSILREQTGLVKMSEAKEEGEDEAIAYSEILNAKIKVNPNRHPADEKMFCGTYFIGTYEEGDLAGHEYVFVLADSEGHRFMNEYMGYPKDKDGYVDQPTDVITLNGRDEVYFMVEPEELFKEKVEESIVMNENTGDPDFDTIEQALMGIRGTAKVEFDYRPNDGVYKKPQDHFIVLVFEDDIELEDETTLNVFNDATTYFKNRKQWKLGVINKLKELGWKLEDPIEDNSSYLYLVMEKIKPEAKTEGYETLDGNKVEVYSDYETAKSRALMLGLKEAEYGDEFGSDVSYCAWNKSGDRNEEVEVLAYYKFENGKPVALTDEEKATVESVKEITFDDITGPINLN